MPDVETLAGRCACGCITFRARGPFREGVACHCETCRRQSGHYIVATATAIEKLDVTGAEDLTWYGASPHARRGFCRKCGSLLFWEPENRSHVSIMMGAVDDPGDIRLSRHIFVGEKGAYYEIGDGLPEHGKG